MAGIGVNTDLSLKTIATAGGQTGTSVTLGGLRGKTLYDADNNTSTTPAAPNSISMSVLKNRTFTTNVTKPPAPGAPLVFEYLSGSTKIYWLSNGTGGSPITSYSWSTSNNGTGLNNVGNTTFAIIYTGATIYTYATNIKGTSVASAGNYIGVYTAPGTPIYLGLTWTTQYTLLNASWYASNSGSAPTFYTVVITAPNGASSTYYPTNTYIDMPVVSGFDYTVYVSANNQVGNSGNAIASSPTQLTAPTNLRITSSSSGSTTVSWDPPASTGGKPITTYYLYNPNTAPINLGNVFTRTFTSTVDTTINIYISAFTDVQGPYTAAFSVPIRIAPGAPRSVNAYGGFNQMYVKWVDPSTGTVTNYKIDWIGPTTGTANQTTLTYVITGLSAGSYTVTVTAYNGATAGTSSSAPADSVGLKQFTTGNTYANIYYPANSLLYVYVTVAGGGGGGGPTGYANGAGGGGGGGSVTDYYITYPFLRNNAGDTLFWSVGSKGTAVKNPNTGNGNNGGDSGFVVPNTGFYIRACGGGGGPPANDGGGNTSGGAGGLCYSQSSGGTVNNWYTLTGTLIGNSGGNGGWGTGSGTQIAVGYYNSGGGGGCGKPVTGLNINATTNTAGTAAPTPGTQGYGTIGNGGKGVYANGFTAPTGYGGGGSGEYVYMGGGNLGGTDGGGGYVSIQVYFQ